MLTKLTVNSFKSLESVEVALGQINVFIGANGSGKSNLLEALGVLSAAAAGRVDDEALMRRGVRQGSPKFYKTAFPGLKPQHIVFKAENDESCYEVALSNPTTVPEPAWSYQTEKWESKSGKIVERPSSTPVLNPEAGLAALRAVERKPNDPALEMLNLLRDYAIYEPNTPSMRGTPENQSRRPIGLSGEGLPQTLFTLFANNPGFRDGFHAFEQLIDWAKGVRIGPRDSDLANPSSVPAHRRIHFLDRYMDERNNVISGADASEGALYILFSAILALDDRVPSLIAIDNADHGLNPRLARRLMKQFCESILSNPKPRQVLLTTHNPLVLDGLPLQDDRVRLFTVDRTATGRTVVNRVQLTKELRDKASSEGALSRLWVMGHLGGVPNV